jgi:hypothetical protein
LQEAKEEYSKAVEELAAFAPSIREKFKHRLHIHLKN